MHPEPAKPLRIFLSYAHADVASVRKLHRYLREKGFDVWFDKENLVPGHDWRLEIEEGLYNSDVVIVCLSLISVNKEGFVQKEFNFALDKVLEMPEGRISLIPVRLQDCKVPRRLGRYHWVDLFENEDEGYKHLMRGLKRCAEQLERAQIVETQPPTAQDEAAKGEKQTAEDEDQAMKKAEAQKIFQEQAEQERIARENAEAKRIAGEKVEAEKTARKKLEQERVAMPNDKNDRVEREKAEQKRLARQKAQGERVARQKMEYERNAHEKAERTLRARAQTWARLKSDALLFGVLMTSVGCLVLWFLNQVFSPSRTVPTTTLRVFASETRLPATSTIAPPTNIPFTSTPSLTPTLVAGAVTTSPKDGMKLHYVPAGSFKMGSNNGQVDEEPAHQVTLDAFWIDETEVTNKMYAMCVKDTECQPPKIKGSSTHALYYDDPQFADYPVIYTSWNDATAYCTWAGRKLPSEAEWEKAARGPNGNTYPWGDAAPDKDLLNYHKNVGDTSKVGLYPNDKSFYGAYDMAGNVWEWVNDWYDVYPGGDPHATIRFGQTYSVLRGGSWYIDDYYVRSSYRFYKPRFNSATDFGFRCALSQK